jgi:type I restriction enzyme, S subunit
MDRPFIGGGFKVSKIKDVDLPALLLQRVARLRPSYQLTLEYLWAFLQSHSFQSGLQRKQQGTQLPHISKYDIENTIIPLRNEEKQNILSKQYGSFATWGKLIIFPR